VTPKAPKHPARTDDEVRETILRYLYERNRTATNNKNSRSGLRQKDAN
jgi:hypothetical protein